MFATPTTPLAMLNEDELNMYMKSSLQSLYYHIVFVVMVISRIYIDFIFLSYLILLSDFFHKYLDCSARFLYKMADISYFP